MLLWVKFEPATPPPPPFTRKATRPIDHKVCENFSVKEIYALTSEKEGDKNFLELRITQKLLIRSLQKLETYELKCLLERYTVLTSPLCW